MGLFRSQIESHHELLDQYHAKHAAGLKSGSISPFVYPYEAFGIYLLLAYLFISHQRYPLVRRARYIVFLLIAYFESSTILRCKTTTGGTGFGIGIVCGFGIVWAAAAILFTDPQKDFKRLDKRRHHGQPKDTLSSQSNANGSASSATSDAHSNGGPVWRGPKKSDQVLQDSPDSDAGSPNFHPSSEDEDAVFFWQPFPEGLLSRLNWITDLMFSFRGIGWNWMPPGLVHLPRNVQMQLEGREKGSPSDEVEVRQGSMGHLTYYTRPILLRRKAIELSIYYLTLDFLKVVFMRDPYFWGLVDQPPPTFLPEILRQSEYLTRTYRLLLSLAGVVIALNAIFAPCGLLFVGVFGETYAGVRAEPWLYPDLYGGFSMVLNKGLAGFWGGWWHQIFRFGFSAPTDWIVSRLNLDRRATSTRTLQLLIAFSLSGFIHACGSYTSIPPTNPFTGPFLFFFLQAFGITAQVALSVGLKRAGITPQLPKTIRQAGNFIFVFTWLFFVAPLLTDDFARSGVWLFEPVPLSPLRALGFGVKGDKWWCWGDVKIWWHTGYRWWQSGLAL
ncbi:MAG: hypothetical protein M4579_000246 [Chaenotheca gracillima]|nr:MAG: hypothetical protein M4579_000246 [Chaenotheca gracillima]